MFMRVLHMMGSLEMGGAQTMLMSIYRVLDKSKIQFDFVIDTEEVGYFAKEIRRLGGRIWRLPKFTGKNRKAVQHAWRVFLKEHPEYRILHSHVRSYASLYIPVAKECGLKTIIHSHNTSNGKGIKAIGKMILQLPLRDQADYFFGCSERAGQWLFGKKVVESDRFFILKNAVDLERFKFDSSARRRIRDELNVDDDTLLLGHIGRFHPQKNHRFLLGTFIKLKEQRAKTKLVLLGDGELKEEIAQYIHKNELNDDVLLLGIKENTEDYLSAMDALLFPSVHEGLPVVVIEAQANGLTSMISDTITREVGISDLVCYLPINQGFLPWIDILRKYVPVRRDVTNEIRHGGYSVRDSANWLYDFYMTINV